MFELPVRSVIVAKLADVIGSRLIGGGRGSMWCTRGVPALLLLSVASCAGHAGGPRAQISYPEDVPLVFTEHVVREECAVQAPRVARSSYTEKGRGLDIDGDETADVIRRDDGYLFRVSLFPVLNTTEEWVLLTSKRDQDFVGTVTPIDFALESSLGVSAAPLATGAVGLFEQAAQLANAGEEPPVRILAGAVAPGVQVNASLKWKTDDRGVINWAEIVYDDTLASGGVQSAVVEATDIDVSIPAISIADAALINDLPAAPLLLSRLENAGCFFAEPEIDAGSLECARQVVGSATVGEWVADRKHASYILPRECADE